LLENYYLPGDLEASVGTFVVHYNHHRYHQSLANLTPADVYFGREHAIIKKEKDQRTDHPKAPLSPSEASGITSTRMSQSLR